MTFTTVLAAYGAIVSTIALSWSIFRDVTDRGRLRVHCFLGSMVAAGHSDDRTYLIYQVTNVGRRPVVVTHIGGRRLKAPGDAKTGFIIIPRNLPKTLQPGEYLMEYSPDLHDLLGVRAYQAYDSHGRAYTATRSDLKEIRKHLPDVIARQGRAV
jgi:hypothetical protein